MTMQITDLFIFDGEKYNLINTDLDIDLYKYGLYPMTAHTACWRGYVSEYAIENNYLIIKNLYINCNNYWGKEKIIGKYPDLFGVKAIEIPESECYNISYGLPYGYCNINHVISYTGTIILGKDYRGGFSSEDCLEDGPYRYNVEITVNKGQVTNIKKYEKDLPDNTIKDNSWGDECW